MKKIFLYLAVAILTSGTLLFKQQKGTATSESFIRQEDGRISDDSLLTLTEYRTFQYFWDGAEPVSGMAPERINMDGVYILKMT